MTDSDFDRYERAKDVLLDEGRRPVLYDAKNRPLVREVGFRVTTNAPKETGR